jgi:GntR family transcriptional regulator
MGNQGGIAYYRQIADRLIQRIYDGEYALGEQLPSDRELSIEFGHHRHTVRRALDIVEAQALITRHQGRGTFVADILPPPTEKTRLPIGGLIDMTRRLGQRPEAKVLSVSIIQADNVSGALQINPDEQVIYLHRLRLIGDEPVILEHIYVPHRLVPGLEREDLNQSLRDLMAEQYRLSIARKEIEFESILSNSYAAQHLQIAVGSPLMLEKRVAFTPDDLPCEYSKHIYRGDRFLFSLRQ